MVSVAIVRIEDEGEKEEVPAGLERRGRGSRLSGTKQVGKCVYYALKPPDGIFSVLLEHAF
jgi:hypothetical protein